MALVQVREKGAPADAPVGYVDEAWLEQWPDDFERVPEDEPAAAASAPAAPAEPEPRRRSNPDF